MRSEFQAIAMLMRIIIVLSMVTLFSCAGGDILSKAKVGDVAGIKQSLDSGTSIETKYDRSGQTVLIVAARNNRVEAVKYLCEQGANVNAQDIYGTTALHQATFYNFERVVKVLLEYNADKGIKDNKGRTAIDYAKEYDYNKIIKMLGYGDN